MSSRRGLGSFLLRGFKKRQRATPLVRAFGSDFSRRTRSRRAKLPAKPRKKRNLPERAVPGLPVPRPQNDHVGMPPASGELAVSSFSSLIVTDLLKPADDLKLSIEGFLLDQRSPHTRRAYGKDLKRFLKFLVVRKAQKGNERVERHLLIAYKDQLLSEGLEHTTIDRHLATLRSFFRWLVDDGKIARSPVEGVRFLNPKRMSRTIGFTDAEVARLLAKPDLHTRTGAQHYAILTVLFYCGLRRSEVCALRTPNLSVEREQPVIRLTGKGNAERLIVLTPTVWRALRHYLAITRKDVKKDQPLFTPIRNNRTGEVTKPLDPSMIFYIVTRYAKLAGIANRVSPHSCRATAISNARDHQVSDRAIQEFAGWASPDMITRYDKRKSAIEKSAAHAIRYGAEERFIPTGAGGPAEETRPTRSCVRNDTNTTPETLKNAEI